MCGGGNVYCSITPRPSCVRGSGRQHGGSESLIVMCCSCVPLHVWLVGKPRVLKTVVQNLDADKSLARPGRKQANVSVRMARISFGALPCRKRNLMTARVLVLLKSRASLTCFGTCFLPGRAKDLSAAR